MKRRVLIFIFLVATGLSATQSQSLKSDTIDVLNYTIHLDLKHLSHLQLYGATDITATPRLASINSFSLDLRKLTVDSVLLNGTVHSNYSYNDTVLRILLSTPLTITDTFVLRVVYHGVPLIEPYNWGGFHFLNDSSLAYNLGVAFDDYPHNYGRVWFPCLDDFIDRATYDLHIRTKGTHKAVGGGVLIDTTHHSDGSITWHWSLAEPIPTYLASVAAGEFVIIEAEYHGLNDTIPILLYVRAVDSAKAAVSFSNLGDMMSIYESKFGPYQWPRVGFTGTVKGAMEHATNVAMPRNLITGNFAYDWLIAHELSHSWFGNLVTCSSAEDMWINEGWARYCEAIYFEGTEGWEAYKAYIMNIQKKVLNFAHTTSANGDGSWFPIYPVPQTHTYGTTVYDKGGLTAHTLRGYLGDSIFFDAIKAMLGQFAFQPMSSYQMRDFLTQHTGINMTPFFEGWIFTPGFPHFSIDSVVSVPQGNGFNVTVHLKQKMAGRTTLTDDNIVEIGFYADRNTRELRRAQFSGASGQQTFWLPFDPVLVLADPEERLSDAITAKTAEVSTTGTLQFPDQFFRLATKSITDTMLLRIEHSWVPPDPLLQPVNGLTLSPNRYWKINGIVPPGSEIDGTFNYSTGNYFDNALITNNVDSLVILYRSYAGEEWHGVPFVKSNAVFSGIITVADLKMGEYVLAKWDKDHIGIREQDNIPNSGILIFPNPATDRIQIRSNGEQHLNIRISAINGNLVLQDSVLKGEFISSINISGFSSGIYMVEITDKAGSVIKSEKIKISR